MSERIAYEELRPGTEVRAGDQYRNTQGRWVEYSLDTSGTPIVGPTTVARRPIGTAQQAVDQPQRERIAYEELQVGDVIQEGDEWRNEDGRWQPFTSLTGSRVQVRHSQRARRPHNITMMLAEFANQAEVLAEVRADEKRLFDDLELLRNEYLKLQSERDELRVEIQNLLKTITNNADQFANTGKILEHERNEARAELQRLQEVVSNLYSEPTARQVQDMLHTWATELDWSAGCFGSFGRSQIDIIQQTMVAVIQRIETMIHPEGGTDGE